MGKIGLAEQMVKVKDKRGQGLLVDFPKCYTLFQKNCHDLSVVDNGLSQSRLPPIKGPTQTTATAPALR